ncbi:P-loop containing nucleoside triphosphate hydrolase protein [Auriculariales sp. MPI-PUGE-AT-0066]|nr:P-loop containing nucleoside triphosphate hydrolase protein [Auriculariales sp. MPI-PUGE-AT-0066]
MSQYSVIILDEAHERTIATDVLFGLLKKTVKRRPDLKVIITSATPDAEKFSKYSMGCPIFSIPGRTYPVEIMYTKKPESDYLDASLITVMQIHLSVPPGDILLFLTGKEEIETACEVLFERMGALGAQVPELMILPVYSALPSEMQTEIFEPASPDARKVVIATNIAETSITIDGIYYVVDPGFVKQNVYDSRLASRPFWANWTRRLYTEVAYRNEMLPNPVLDIQRQNLANIILDLKAMGINDLMNFDFMDPPPTQTLLCALEVLYALSALDGEGLLTRLSRKMADFPLDPPLAKMLIASVDLGCSEEILSIVAMLSVQNVFYRPKDKQTQAESKKAEFYHAEGDHLTLLAVYNGWKGSGFSNPWCYANFIQARSMKRAQDVRKQMLGIMDRYRHGIVSADRDYNCTVPEGTPVYIHPSSALFNCGPEWLIYHDLVLTTREYCHNVTAIEPKWLVEVAPQFFKVADANRISKSKKQEKIEPLYSKFPVLLALLFHLCAFVMVSFSSTLSALLSSLLLAQVAAAGTFSSRFNATIARRASVDGPVSFGYYPNWVPTSYPPSAVPTDKISHLLYAFAKTDGKTGAISLGDPEVDAGDLEGENLAGLLGDIWEIKQKSRGLKVLLSIGGGSFSQNGAFDFLTDSAGRAKFVEDATTMLEDFGLDGIDIDYEALTNDQIEGYHALVKAMRAGLDAHAETKGETSAVGVKPNSDLDTAVLDESFDFWNMMDYDMSGSWTNVTGHQANLYSPNGGRSIDGGVKEWLTAVAPEKLVMGIPLYSRSFTGTDGAGSPYDSVGPTDGESRYIDLPLDGAVVTEDLEHGLAYSYDAAKREFHSYDTPGVVKVKTQYVVDNKLGGMMYWAPYMDKDGAESLLNTAVDGLGGKLDQTPNHLSYPNSKYANVKAKASEEVPPPAGGGQDDTTTSTDIPTSTEPAESSTSSTTATPSATKSCTTKSRRRRS